MRNTTLCYIERDGAYLLLHRVKKKKDVNEGKWIGIGGGIEEGETPDECLLREVREETGLQLLSYRFVGRILFLSDVAPAEVMHLYHATDFAGEVAPVCNEGILAWVDKKEARALPMWEGDRIFLDLLEEGVPPFRLTLRYQGHTLVEAVRDEL